MTGDEFLEADGLEAAIGLGDGARLDLAEGRDGRGILDGLQAIRPEPGLVTRHEDRSVALRADLDRLDDRALAMTDRRTGRRPRLAAGRLIRGAPLDDVLGVHDRDRPPDEFGQCLGDLSGGRRRTARCS